MNQSIQRKTRKEDHELKGKRIPFPKAFLHVRDKKKGTDRQKRPIKKKKKKGKASGEVTTGSCPFRVKYLKKTGSWVWVGLRVVWKGGGKRKDEEQGEGGTKRYMFLIDRGLVKIKLRLKNPAAC